VRVTVVRTNARQKAFRARGAGSYAAFRARSGNGRLFETKLSRTRVTERGSSAERLAALVDGVAFVL
jgi:hypothetical protein